MSQYNGTKITKQEQAELVQGAGAIVDEYNDKAQGLSGTAYSSGIRLWNTPEGPILESPATLEQARKLAGIAPQGRSPIF